MLASTSALLAPNVGPNAGFVGSNTGFVGLHVGSSIGFVGSFPTSPQQNPPQTPLPPAESCLSPPDSPYFPPGHHQPALQLHVGTAQGSVTSEFSPILNGDSVTRTIIKPSLWGDSATSKPPRAGNGATHQHRPRCPPSPCGVSGTWATRGHRRGRGDQGRCSCAYCKQGTRGWWASLPSNRCPKFWGRFSSSTPQWGPWWL